MDELCKFLGSCTHSLRWPTTTTMNKTTTASIDYFNPGKGNGWSESAERGIKSGWVGDVSFVELRLLCEVNTEIPLNGRFPCLRIASSSLVSSSSSSLVELIRNITSDNKRFNRKWRRMHSTRPHQGRRENPEELELVEWRSQGGNCYSWPRKWISIGF